jgi:hypothetical protein
MSRAWVNCHVVNLMIKKWSIVKDRNGQNTKRKITGRLWRVLSQDVQTRYIRVVNWLIISGTI